MTLISFLSENRRWLAAGALLTFISSFGQTYFISIFAGQIMGDYGLSGGGAAGFERVLDLVEEASRGLLETLKNGP